MTIPENVSYNNKTQSKTRVLNTTLTVTCPQWDIFDLAEGLELVLKTSYIWQMVFTAQHRQETV